MVIRCLDCAGELQSGASAWMCTNCRRTYSATLGIPDLRGDCARDHDEPVAHLLQAYPSSTFAELLALRTPGFSTDDPRLIALYTEYRGKSGERGRKFYDMVARRVADFGGLSATGVCLIIGCGCGSSTVRAASAFSRVVGLDQSLPDLILAKKAVEQAGLANVTLIQGYAQRMPFPGAAFDLIVGENVLEHVIDIEGVLAECARTLRQGGWFVADSVNRFNLLRPEPHVRLWGVGLLPRSLQSRYVRWRRGFDGYEKAVRLLSYRELGSSLRRHLGRGSRIVFPGLDAYGFPERFDAVLQAIEKIPVFGALLLWVFPVHLAIARRPLA